MVREEAPVEEVAVVSLGNERIAAVRYSGTRYFLFLIDDYFHNVGVRHLVRYLLAVIAFLFDHMTNLVIFTTSGTLRSRSACFASHDTVLACSDSLNASSSVLVLNSICVWLRDMVDVLPMSRVKYGLIRIRSVLSIAEPRHRV